jgi:hypothetical protein
MAQLSPLSRNFEVIWCLKSSNGATSFSLDFESISKCFNIEETGAD